MTYELSAVGRERYREITQKRKKESQIRTSIPPDAQVILSIIIKSFCSGPSVEAEFKQRTLRRGFAELLSFDNVFPKNFCPDHTLYAILGNIALKDCRNIFPPISDDQYAQAVRIPIEDIAYFRKELFKRIFPRSLDLKTDWFTIPDYEDFLLELVSFELDNWNNGDAAWRWGNLDWRHDAEIQADLRKALPTLIDDIRSILQIMERPPPENQVWEANANKLIKQVLEMLGGEEPEDRATMKKMLRELTNVESHVQPGPVAPVQNTRHKKAGTTTHGKSPTTKVLACEVCGERYSLPQVKYALEKGKMKCSCGNDLTKAARAWLDSADE